MSDSILDVRPVSGSNDSTVGVSLCQEFINKNYTGRSDIKKTITVQTVGETPLKQTVDVTVKGKLLFLDNAEVAMSTTSATTGFTSMSGDSKFDSALRKLSLDNSKCWVKTRVRTNGAFIQLRGSGYTSLALKVNDRYLSSTGVMVSQDEHFELFDGSYNQMIHIAGDIGASELYELVVIIGLPENTTEDFVASQLIITSCEQFEGGNANSSVLNIVQATKVVEVSYPTASLLTGFTGRSANELCSSNATNGNVVTFTKQSEKSNGDDRYIHYLVKSTYHCVRLDIRGFNFTKIRVKETTAFPEAHGVTCEIAKNVNTGATHQYSQYETLDLTNHTVQQWSYNNANLNLPISILLLGKITEAVSWTGRLILEFIDNNDNIYTLILQVNFETQYDQTD